MPKFRIRSGGVRKCGEGGVAFSAKHLGRHVFSAMDSPEEQIIFPDQKPKIKFRGDGPAQKGERGGIDSPVEVTRKQP